MTNGIAHRRWLNQANPRLASLISSLIGDSYVSDADKLEELLKYSDDDSVLRKLEEIQGGVFRLRQKNRGIFD